MANKELKKKSKVESGHNIKKSIIILTIVLFITFFGAFLIFFILQLALNTQYPIVVVISDSMEPNIYRGDLLFLNGIDDPATIRNGTVEEKDGEIIVFDASGLWMDAPVVPIVHRVVGKFYNDSLDMWFFYTKGDANENMDGSPHPWVMGVPVPASRIHGIISGRIPYIGWIKIYLTDYFLLIPILIILYGSLIISIIKEYKEERNIPQEEEKNI